MLIKFSWDTKQKHGLISGDGDVFNSIREAFSVKNIAATFNKHNPWIPQRKYAITPTGRFEPGLLFEIQKYTHTQFPGIEVIISSELQELVISPLNVPIFTSLSQELRYYQTDIVEKCLKQGRGTVVLATAGGKTLTIAALINSIYQTKKDLKCLVIVPDLGLVSQIYNEFSTLGVTFSVSKWTGKQKLNLGTNAVIANLGILQSECSDIDWIEDIDVLVVDECLRQNTIINTKQGKKSIQDVYIGDYVLSYNIEASRKEYKKVVNLWKNLPKSNSDYFLEIKLKDGKVIHLTPNHKILTQRGYIQAKYLNLQDDIFCINSSKLMHLWYKYLYAKTNWKIYMQNLWQRGKIYFKTSKKSS
jgi:hypothetical protein